MNVWFYTADEKLRKYGISFSEDNKNQEKLTQSKTPRQHTKNRDCPGKIGTVGMFPKASNNKHDWNSVKYLNVLYPNRTQKQLRYFFLIYFKNKLPFLGTLDMSGFHRKSIIQLVEMLILMNSIINSIHNFFLEML